MTDLRNATVLFTDLVGSTELSTSLSTDAADELRRSHFADLRAAIAETGGTEVKSLGDGLMVTFSGTTSSLACAEVMQQSVVRRNRRASIPIAIRIGISTGDVTEEDGDFFGEPVIEAARLCAVAQGNQTLAADVVKSLTRRSRFGFVNERELELKGLPDPIVAWEVMWRPAEDDPAGMSLPPQLPQTPAIGVIGRDREMAALSEALKRVTTGDGPEIVLISGEEGIGKSTITSSLARRAQAEGALVLFGRCDDDLVVPYRPIVEALGHYLSDDDRAPLSEMSDGHLSALGRMLPDFRKRHPELPEANSSDPDAERWLLYTAVVALLQSASSTTPVVLLLEDLHWADRPTLQLLRHICAGITARMLVVGTYRDKELSAAHPLTDTLAALVRERSVTRLALTGLEDHEVALFFEAAAGHEMDEVGMNLAHAVYQETNGNPFFVTEVLRHLAETRAIVQDDSGRWLPAEDLAKLGLPESVRNVIDARAARLGDDAVRILTVASVLGQEFDVAVLADVLGSDEEVVLDVLEAAASAALTAEVKDGPGRFRFAHALVQHTLYDNVGVTRAARLHRSAAEALESWLGDDPGNRAGELCRHWLLAGPPAESEKAARYARLAGANALETLAPAEAVKWFDQAIAILGRGSDEGERAGCLAGLGEAQRQLGDGTYRETLLEAASVARVTGDVDVLVQAALANNRGVPSAGGLVDHERVNVLRDALDALGPSESKARARLLALKALELTFDADYESRRSWTDEALTIARRTGDAATILDVLLRRAVAISVPDTTDELLVEAVEAVAIADQQNDPVGKFWAILFRTAFQMQLGDASELDRAHEDCSRLSSSVGQPILHWYLTARLSLAALLFGNVVQAEALANEALHIGTDTGQPDVLSHYAGQLMMVRWQQGRVGEVADFMIQVASENPSLTVARTAAAHALVESGRESEAAPMLAAEMALGLPGHEDLLLPSYLYGWANVAYRLGDRQAAEVLYPRLLPWRRLLVFTAATLNEALALSVATLASVLRRFDDAEAHFVQALQIHERLGAPFFVARTHLEWSRMLLQRRSPGDVTHAERMLRTALDNARAHGYAGIEESVTTELSTMS